MNIGMASRGSETCSFSLDSFPFVISYWIFYFWIKVCFNLSATCVESHREHVKQVSILMYSHGVECVRNEHFRCRFGLDPISNLPASDEEYWKGSSKMARYESTRKSQSRPRLGSIIDQSFCAPESNPFSSPTFWIFIQSRVLAISLSSFFSLGVSILIHFLIQVGFFSFCASLAFVSSLFAHSNVLESAVSLQNSCLS